MADTLAPETVLHDLRVRMEGEEKSPWTVKQYLSLVREFLVHVNKAPSEVTALDVQRYREYLVLERRYAKASVYLALRAIGYFLRANGSHVSDAVEVPRRSQRLPSFLNEEETHRLLATTDGDPRAAAILRLLCYGGFRVGELCKLELSDVDLESSLIRVRRGKGDKDRVVVIDESAVEALRGWLEKARAEGQEGPSLFGVVPRTVERMVKDHARSAGLQKHVTPHTLRHTLATTLLRHGLDIRFIQKQLGHASVATTELYTHVDTEALQAAYRAAKPKY
jgi:integrase/recombinase XerD